MSTFNNFIRDIKQISYNIPIAKTLGFQSHSVGYVCPVGRIALVSVVSTSSVPANTATQGFIPSTSNNQFGRSITYTLNFLNYRGFMVLKGGEELKYYASNPQSAPAYDDTAIGVISVIELDANQSLG